MWSGQCLKNKDGSRHGRLIAIATSFQLLHIIYFHHNIPDFSMQGFCQHLAQFEQCFTAELCVSGSDYIPCCGSYGPNNLSALSLKPEMKLAVMYSTV